SASGFDGSVTSPSTSRPRPRRARALLLAVLALAPAGRAAAEDRATLPALIERFDHLTVGKAMLVGPMTLSSGHLECKLQSGNAAPVLAGDDVVGVYFEGTGAMEYLSVDSVEAPSVMFNARKGSALRPEKTEKGVRLRDNFTRILWLAQGQAVPAPSGQPGSSLTAGFATQREKFRRLSGAPLSYAFAIQKLNTPETPMVRAEMDGGAEGLVYELGGALNPSEGLFAV